MADDPTPELFVARDRARRFARRITDARTERKFSYRGAAVGMETLVDRADKDLKGVLEDIETTCADIVAGRIRDRERGYMELPLVVMAQGVHERVARARQVERERKSGKARDAEAKSAVLVLLGDAVARIDAFCAAYDAKQPVGPAQLTDLGRILERVERDRAFVSPAPPGEAPKPSDRTPPSVRTDVQVVEDLFRAARSAVDAPGPWRISPAKPGSPLVLAIGHGAGLVRVEPPERLEHVLRVLAHMQPVEIRCLGTPPIEAGDTGLLSEPVDTDASVSALEVLLSDDAAGRLETVLHGCAGADARLTGATEQAVRALLDAPPMSHGAPPPARTVAWLGLIRAVESEIARALLPPAKTPVSRVQASQVPRESTRKAPVRRDLIAALEQRFPDFPAQRVGDVAKAVADGKLGTKLAPADAAALLSVVGRTWRFGGQDRRRAMDLGPLTNEDAEELIQDLSDHARVRKVLEAGKAVDAADATRFERATIAILGRLGRL